MDFKLAPELFWIPTRISSKPSYAGCPVTATLKAMALPAVSTAVTVITALQSPLESLPTDPAGSPTFGELQGSNCATASCPPPIKHPHSTTKDKNEKILNRPRT